LKILKQYFKGWGFSLQGDLKKQRCSNSEEIKKLEALEEVNGLNAELAEIKTRLICENLFLLDQEETYWYNRSHEQWLLKGDNNTSYFHRVANGRKRKNRIITFECDGNIIEGDEDLLQHASDYYAELFGPEIEHNIQIELDKVSDLENELLCRPFSESEIKESLYQMEKKQSSWPR